MRAPLHYFAVFFDDLKGLASPTCPCEALPPRKRRQAPALSSREAVRGLELQGEMAVPYQLIRQAILDRRCASALYEDYIRVFCPRTIGKDKDGADVVEAFQYGGGHPGGLSSGACGVAFE